MTTTAVASGRQFSRQDLKVANEMAYEDLVSRDYTRVKRAEMAMQPYIRTTVLEDGILPFVLTPQTITDSELDRRVESVMPSVIVDIEPESPGAVTISMGDLPPVHQIGSRRAPITFQRVSTQHYSADVEMLRTWRFDLRQAISDKAAKLHAKEKDAKLFTILDSLMGGPGVVMPTSGMAQWTESVSGISRDSLVEMKIGMMQTEFSLVPTRAVTNAITWTRFLKLDRVEFGGDEAQRMMTDGTKVLKDLMDMTWLITIKKTLVPNGRVYMFAHEDYIGRHYELTPLTMYVDAKAYFINWFMYDYSGAAVIHTGGISAHTFNDGLSA